VLYFIFMTITIIFILIKIINIAKNPSITKFPEKCNPPTGCARVMVFDENHRDTRVKQNNIFSIQHIGVGNTDDLIKSCIDKQSQSRLQKVIHKDDGSLFHINTASLFWGFVDDIFIETIPCTKSSGGPQETSLGINIQSQLRFGGSDFGVNPRRIANFLACLNRQIPTNHIGNRGNA